MVLAASAVLLAPPLFAQSLGEAAQKERERRAALKKQPGKVVTDEDLKKTTGETSTPTEASPSPTQAQTSRRPMTAAQEAGKSGGAFSGDERAWRDRAGDLREGIAGAERALKDAEARAEALRLDMDPNRGALDPNRMQRLQADQTAAAAQIEKAKKELAAAKQGLADLEEEARRASVPPGWLR